MGLTFGAVNTNVVSHGTGLASFTSASWCGWVKATTLTALNTMFARDSSTAAGNFAPGVCVDTLTAQIRAEWKTAGGALRYITNNAALTTGRWIFVAFTVDQGAASTARIHIYVGDLTTPVAECTYGTKLETGTTYHAHVGTATTAGNLISNTIAWQGQIACGMFYPNVVLTLAQIAAMQYRFIPQPSGCKIFTHYGFNGTSTQPDWSGNGNNGTVTGATIGDHVPLGPPFAFDDEAVYYATPAAFLAAWAARQPVVGVGVY